MTVKELATKILEEIGYSPYAIAEYERGHVLNSAYGKFQEPTDVMLEVIRRSEEEGEGDISVFAIVESTPLEWDLTESSYQGMLSRLPDPDPAFEQFRNERFRWERAFGSIENIPEEPLRTVVKKRDPRWVPRSVSYLAVREEEARIAQENEDAGRPLLEGIVDVEEDGVYGFYADVEDALCGTDYITLTVRKGVLCLVH